MAGQTFPQWFSIMMMQMAEVVIQQCSGQKWFLCTYKLCPDEALPQEDARRADDVVQHSAVLDQRTERLLKPRVHHLLLICLLGH